MTLLAFYGSDLQWASLGFGNFEGPSAGLLVVAGALGSAGQIEAAYFQRPVCFGVRSQPRFECWQI